MPGCRSFGVARSKIKTVGPREGAAPPGARRSPTRRHPRRAPPVCGPLFGARGHQRVRLRSCPTSDPDEPAIELQVAVHDRLASEFPASALAAALGQRGPQTVVREHGPDALGEGRGIRAGDAPGVLAVTGQLPGAAKAAGHQGGVPRTRPPGSRCPGSPPPGRGRPPGPPSEDRARVGLPAGPADRGLPGRAASPDGAGRRPGGRLPPAPGAAVCRRSPGAVGPGPRSDRHGL